MRVITEVDGDETLIEDWLKACPVPMLRIATKDSDSVKDRILIDEWTDAAIFVNEYLSKH